MSANEFCAVARQFATEEYMRLYVQNILRIRKYGATSARDRKLAKLLEKAVQAGVSETPYESRNSERYLEAEQKEEEKADKSLLLGDFGICEEAASEYVDAVERCSNAAYFMAYNEHRNGIQDSNNAIIVDERGGNPISFTEVQRRARIAGVSLVPFETKRSVEYSRNLELLLRPIYLFA